MKKTAIALSLLLCVSFAVTACSFDNNRQRDTAIGAGGGAGGGALLGQIIGGDTASTLIGAALGTAIGGVIGNIYGDHQDEQAK